MISNNTKRVLLALQTLLVAVVVLTVPLTASAAILDGFGFSSDVPTIDLSADFSSENSVSISETTRTECKVSASVSEVNFGDSVTITWETEGFDTIKLNGKTVSGKSGNVTFKNVTEDAVHTLEATNSEGNTCDAQVSVACLQPPVPVMPQCPYTAADGVVVDFSGARIYSDRGATKAKTTPEAVDLAAGEYAVRLVAWDGYENRVNISQPNEAYRVVFANDATVVAESNDTNDLKDKVASALFDAQVNSKITLGSAVNNVYALHSVFPDNASPNSLNPICAVFIPAATPAPTCDSFTAAPTTITAGESSVLAWTTTNATKVAIDNGIGQVDDVDGSMSVSPLATTNYKLTAFGADDEKVYCEQEIIVVPDVVTGCTDETAKNYDASAVTDDGSCEYVVPPVCPLVAKDGRTIVNFTDERIRSDQGVANGFTSVKSIDLPAGTYDITLVSWDGYVRRVNASQPNEQWKLTFLANGTVLTETNASTDLADLVIEDTKIDFVNNGLQISNAITAVQGAHAFYPNAQSGSQTANSLNPICAAIDTVVTPAPTCDAFTASPDMVIIGGSTVLNWETTNAVSVSIDNNIGTVAADGTTPVAVVENTTFTLTATGVDGTKAYCEAPVTVSADPVPECKAFTATPSALPVGGGDVTLAWEVIGATSATIAPTIGAVALVDSQTVNVTESTTYELTAVDVSGDEVTCLAPVAVADPEPVFTCADNVTFTASDTSLTRGQSSTLDWTVTDADSVSVTGSGIDETGLTGSESVSPSSDATYTLTATQGSETISCPLDIDVSTGGGGGGSPTPRCELEISDSKISLGDEVTLTWESANATALTLTDDEGTVLVSTDDVLSSEKDELFDSELTLSPTRNTTYTLLVERGSRDRECVVDVELDDDIVVLQTRDQAPLVAGISLSAVPYTGFEAGPIMTVLFYLLLAVWALYITYVLVIPKTILAAKPAVVIPRTNADLMKKSESVRPDVFAAMPTNAVATPVAAPANLPTAASHVAPAAVETPDVPAVATDVATAIENQAHAYQALLSSGAVQSLIAMTTEDNRADVLKKVVADAKSTYPQEDGWIVVNQERLAALTAQTVAPQTVVTGSGSLAEAIVAGNVVAAYDMLGERPMIALADAAADLDALYRNKKGATESVSDMLSAESASLTETQIASMIAALTGALDGTYTDEASAVKMAIMKAIKVTA